METTTKRPSDRGGNKPIDPSKLGSTDRLHRRVEGLIASAIRMGCDRIEVFHTPEGGREALVSTLAIHTDDDGDHTTPRALVDSIVLALQDEAAALAAGSWHPFSIRGVRSTDGADVVRERVRLVGTHKRAEPEAGAALAVGHRDDQELADASGMAMHPREVATLSGMARQQMRHNEALVGSVVKGFGGITDRQARLIDQLSDRVVSLTEKLDKQADAALDVARRTRAIEAEARAEEAKSRAFEVGGEVLKEFLPAALHRISRKYGVAGDVTIDPMMEKMIESFSEEQVAKLAEVFTPLQKAMFAEVWLTVNQRREAEKEKAEKAAKEKAEKERAARGELPAGEERKP